MRGTYNWHSVRGAWSSAGAEVRTSMRDECPLPAQAANELLTNLHELYIIESLYSVGSLGSESISVRCLASL